MNIAIIYISLLAFGLAFGISYAYSSFTYYGSYTDKAISITLIVLTIAGLLELLLGG